MPSRVWQPADALAFRCPVEAVGTLRPASEVLDAIPPALPEPGEMRTRAMLALLRLAESGDGFAAVRAAELLLSQLGQQPTVNRVREPWETGTRYTPPAGGLPELREGGQPGIDGPDLQ